MTAPVIASASSVRPAMASLVPPNTIRSLSCSRNSIRWCAVGAIRHAQAAVAQQQGYEVEGVLEARDVREALVERDDEQEREQHLDARQRDAQLPEQLLEVAIEPLLLGLVAAGVLSLRGVHAGKNGARPPDDGGRAPVATWSGTSTTSRAASGWTPTRAPSDDRARRDEPERGRARAAT